MQKLKQSSEYKLTDTYNWLVITSGEREEEEIEKYKLLCIK